jgi:hypothetical protein
VTVEDGDLRLAIKPVPVGARQRHLGVVVEQGDLEHGGVLEL